MTCGVLESALGGLDLKGNDRSRRRASLGVISWLALTEWDWKRLVVVGGGAVVVDGGGLIVAMAARADKQSEGFTKRCRFTARMTG